MAAAVAPQLIARTLGRIMPIDVLWEEMDWEANPRGPAPTRVLNFVLDNDSLVERFLSDLPAAEFPQLSFISHETVTVFHQRHLGQLITELAALNTRKHDPHVTKHLSAVLELVAAARGEKDTLVAFRFRAREGAT